MKRSRTLLVWILLLFVFVVLYKAVQKRESAKLESFSSFLEQVEEGRVEDVRVNGNEIGYALVGARARFRTLGSLDERVLRSLSEQGVPVRQGEAPDEPLELLKSWAPPLAILVGLLVFLLFLRRASSGGGGNVLALGKSRARLVSEPGGMSFSEVGGCAEAKAELRDAVDFLKDPRPWTEAGARLPRGILLVGPPGCGKTLLARAVAGETNAKFYHISGSEFVEMFVGVGASRVRDMFEVAAKSAPSVIFIDELDAVGRRRGSGLGAAHDEREQTLNQLLVCLDGFQKQDRVVVLAATNRVDILDKALLRPGRFDRVLRIPEPSAEARAETLRIHCRNKALAPEVSLEELAGLTSGWNGAQLESLTNEAALIAVRRTRRAEPSEPVRLLRSDFLDALARARDGHSHLFDKLDSVLIESATQLAEPTGRAHVRLRLEGGSSVEGEILWADSHYLKLVDAASGTPILIPKPRIQAIEALGGTEPETAEELAPDRWAARQPGLV